MTNIHGVLEEWDETGTEGAIWCFRGPDDPQRPNADYMYSLVILREGDHLTVYNADDSVVFDDYLNPDYKIGWAEFPGNPGYGQPTALGFWIHWTQSGWQPDDWARLFFNDPPLRAVLRPGELNKEALARMQRIQHKREQLNFPDK